MTWHGHRVISFGFLPQNLKTMAVAVPFSMAWREAEVENWAGEDWAGGLLAAFRRELYRCFTAQADALFELADSMLCAGGPVRVLAALSLEPEHRRGHGALYDAVNVGRIGVAWLRRALAALPLPAWPDGRIRLAVDVSNWLRPDALTSPERMFCHVYGRGKGNAQMIPGWPYSFVAALEPGRASWTAALDTVRLDPDDDETEVTAAQVRDVVTRLISAGHWHAGDPDILIVFDADYDVRLAWLLAGLPVQLAGRLRSDRLLYFPRRRALAAAAGRPGTGQSSSWPSRYGAAEARAWDRLHPRLTHRAAWEGTTRPPAASAGPGGRSRSHPQRTRPQSRTGKTQLKYQDESVQTMDTDADRLPDEVLLASLGTGDVDFTVTFVHRFQWVVFGVAMTVTGDPGTAEDVAQQTFERAWRHAQVYDSRRGSVRAWMTTIARNLAVDVIHAPPSTPVAPDDLAGLLTAMTDTPERLAVAHEGAAVLRGTLARLPATQARAVAMAGIYGMTARQIADAEGIPLDTAKTRIRDGMQKLRDAYLPEDAGDN